MCARSPRQRRADHWPGAASIKALFANRQDLMWQRIGLDVFVLLALGGCAGGLDPRVSPDAVGPGQDGGGDVAVVLGCARAKTILGACLACHTSQAAGANGGFDMEKPGWEKDLLGQGPPADAATSLCKGQNLIFLQIGQPPARGLFLDKLTQATPVCGVQMPRLLPKLNGADMTCVQQWANSLVAGGAGE
jgi:hypothetical protein